MGKWICKECGESRFRADILFDEVNEVSIEDISENLEVSLSGIECFECGNAGDSIDEIANEMED